MPTIVEVPGHGEVEFPDGMSDEQISTAIRTSMAPAAAAPATQAPDSGLTRFGQGVADPIVGIGQKVAHGAAALASPIPGLGPMLAENAATYDDFAKQREADYSAPEGVDWARIGGNVASPLNLAAGVRATQLAAKLPLLARMGIAVPTGASLGLTQPVTQGEFGEETAKQGAIGGLLGPAAELGGTVASRLIAPKITDAARKLIGENIRLTPGQMLGGAAKTIEDKAMNVLPVLGDAIRGARARSVDDFNRAAANRVLKPIGQSVDETADAGRSLVADVQDRVSGVYDKLIPKLRFDVNDPQFIGELRTIQQATRGLPKQEADRFNAIMGRELAGRIQNGTLTGEAFKAAESQLGRLAREYATSTDAYQKELGQALQSVVTSMRGGLTRSNPQHAQALRAVNEAYANLVRFEGAAAMRGAKEGVVSPANLGAAVKSANKSVRKREYARGDALMQDLSDAAEGTIPSVIPDSGTAGRLALGLGATYLEPNILAALLAGGSLYTRPGQAAFRAYLTPGTARNVLAGIPQRGAIGASSAAIPLVYQGGNQ